MKVFFRRSGWVFGGLAQDARLGHTFGIGWQDFPVSRHIFANWRVTLRALVFVRAHIDAFIFKFILLDLNLVVPLGAVMLAVLGGTSQRWTILLVLPWYGLQESTFFALAQAWFLSVMLSEDDVGAAVRASRIGLVHWVSILDDFGTSHYWCSHAWCGISVCPLRGPHLLAWSVYGLLKHETSASGIHHVTCVGRVILRSVQFLGHELRALPFTMLGWLLDALLCLFTRVCAHFSKVLSRIRYVLLCSTQHIVLAFVAWSRFRTQLVWIA